MECILIRWEARTRTIVRQIAKSADFVRTWPEIWRHNLMTWHDIHFNFFFQYVSNLSTRGYCKFRCDPLRFTRVIREKPWGVRSTPPTIARVNLRPAGGGVVETPLCFFPDCQKTAALCAAVFGTPYNTSFPHMLWKFQTQVTQGQVTRSRQVTSPHQKFEYSPTLHRLNDCLETFSDCYKQEYLSNNYLRISISVT